jgi:hypothetical protein
VLVCDAKFVEGRRECGGGVWFGGCEDVPSMLRIFGFSQEYHRVTNKKSDRTPIIPGWGI